MDDVTAANLSTLARARKLFASLSRALEGEIKRLKNASETEDESQARIRSGVIRQNQRALQLVLELEVNLIRETAKQRPGEGVIDLVQARAEVARRLDRLAG
jgi:hypothetical protein